jgi:hypothetical protein
MPPGQKKYARPASGPVRTAAWPRSARDGEQAPGPRARHTSPGARQRSRAPVSPVRSSSSLMDRSAWDAFRSWRISRDDHSRSSSSVAREHLRRSAAARGLPARTRFGEDDRCPR